MRDVTKQLLEEGIVLVPTFSNIARTRGGSFLTMHAMSTKGNPYGLVHMDHNRNVVISLTQLQKSLDKLKYPEWIVQDKLKPFGIARAYILCMSCAHAFAPRAAIVKRTHSRVSEHIL